MRCNWYWSWRFFREHCNGYSVKHTIVYTDTVFLLLSVVFDVFYNKKSSDNFLAGTLAGLGIATFFTGFSGSIGFGIIIYSILIRDASNEIHNKSRNSDAISSADS